MGSLFLSRSDSSDYVSEAAICSDDGSASTFNTSYNVPINVRNNFANTQIMTPLCCYVINTMTTTDEKLDRSDRTKMIETTFKKFVDDLEYDYLYSSIVDYMVWTRSVEKFCRRRGIDKSDITMTSKLLLKIFSERVEKEKEENIACLKKAIKQTATRTHLYEDLFEATFLTKAYQFAKEGLFAVETTICFINFVLTKLDSDTKRALTWILKLDLYKCIKNFPVESIVYNALMKRETGKLLEICDQDRTKDLARDIVTYIDRIVGGSFQSIDPEHVKMYQSVEVDELRKLDKELINMAFNYRKRFLLDMSVVKNCVFARQMRAFMNAFNEYKKSESARGREGFYQKTMHIMREGGARAQISILAFLEGNARDDSALVLALRMKIPKEQWPEVMKYENDIIEVKERELAIAEEKIQNEQTRIKDGFNLLREGFNIVRVIDTDMAVENILKPFSQDPTNQFFGIDAEWDMSYCGDMGTVCLIQMSGPKETMLIDIHSLRTVRKWPEERFLELFKLIFDHSKNVYGFDLESDLKTISSNFPTFETKLLPDLKNLCCLRVVARKICGDVELRKAIFGEEEIELNLSSLSRFFLGCSLDKLEQSSVWSHRPLRKEQQQYAAKDSYAVVEITKKLIKTVKEKCPDKFQATFAPWTAKQSNDPTGQLPLNKTKASHFTQEELKDVISAVNSKLASDQFTELDGILFITDTMCSPLGACLRRIGISAIPGQNEADVIEHANKHPHSKILTSGRACKKYAFPDRVININSALSLEHQLACFLLDEQLRVDPSKVKPRCDKCNGNEMVYIPGLCLQYLHYNMAVVKNIDIEVDPGIFMELEKKMELLDPRILSKHYCFITKGDWGLSALFPNAIIYLEKLKMHKLENGLVVNPETVVKLQLITHYQIKKEYDNTELQAICYNCGRENVGCSIPV